MYSINLKFKTSNIGDKKFLSSDTRLHLAFASAHSDQVVVWKTIIISSNTNQKSSSGTYSADRVGVCVGQSGRGGMLSGGQMTEVHPGEKWTVTNNNNAYHWNKDLTDLKEKDDSPAMECVNNAGHLLDLVVGVYNSENEPEFEPVLLYKNVAVGDSILVQRQFNLRCYHRANIGNVPETLSLDDSSLLGQWDLRKFRRSNDNPPDNIFTVWEGIGGKLYLDSDMDDISGARTIPQK